MIFGVGVDLARVERFRVVWARRGQRFARRILHALEHEPFAVAGDPARDLAKRWAAKEAYAKALGTKIGRIAAHDIGLLRDPDSGAPRIVLSEHGAAFSERRGAGRVHISLSDEGDLVIAMVVLEPAAGASGP